MGTSALPDMYAQGPRAEGIHIRQSTSAHVTTNMLHFQHSKICPNLMSIFPSVYIVTDIDISITIVGVDFNVSVTSCIVKVLIVGFMCCFL